MIENLFKKVILVLIGTLFAFLPSCKERTSPTGPDRPAYVFNMIPENTTFSAKAGGQFLISFKVAEPCSVWYEVEESRNALNVKTSEKSYITESGNYTWDGSNNNGEKVGTGFYMFYVWTNDGTNPDYQSVGIHIYVENISPFLNILDPPRDESFSIDTTIHVLAQFSDQMGIKPHSESLFIKIDDSLSVWHYYESNIIEDSLLEKYLPATQLGYGDLRLKVKVSDSLGNISETQRPFSVD